MTLQEILDKLLTLAAEQSNTVLELENAINTLPNNNAQIDAVVALLQQAITDLNAAKQP